MTLFRAHAAIGTGNYQKVLDTCREQLKKDEPLGTETKAKVYLLMGEALFLTGAYEDAAQHFQFSLAEIGQVSGGATAHIARLLMGFISCELFQIDSAQMAFESLRMEKEAVWIASTWLGTAVAAMYAEKWEQARGALDQCLSIGKGEVVEGLPWTPVEVKAILVIGQGKWLELPELIPLVAEGKKPHSRAVVAYLEASALLKKGDPVKAAEGFRQAETLLGEVSEPEWEWRISWGLARAYKASGNLKKAQDAFTVAQNHLYPMYQNLSSLASKDSFLQRPDRKRFMAEVPRAR